VDAVLADGTPDTSGSPYSENIFTGECISVAMTFAYMGDRKTAEEVARRLMDNIVLRLSVGWELPNTIDAVTGEVVHAGRTFTRWSCGVCPWLLAARAFKRRARPEILSVGFSKALLSSLNVAVK